MGNVTGGGGRRGRGEQRQMGNEGCRKDDENYDDDDGDDNDGEEEERDGKETKGGEIFGYLGVSDAGDGGGSVSGGNLVVVVVLMYH